MLGLFRGAFPERTTTTHSRKDARAQITMLARYRSPVTFEYVEEACFDLSVGGMFVRTDAPAATGTLLKLECDGDRPGTKFLSAARVVWVRRTADSEGPVGMGIKFIRLQPNSRAAIEDILGRVTAAIAPPAPVSAAPAAPVVVAAPKPARVSDKPRQAPPPATPWPWMISAGALVVGGLLFVLSGGEKASVAVPVVAAPVSAVASPEPQAAPVPAVPVPAVPVPAVPVPVSQPALTPARRPTTHRASTAAAPTVQPSTAPQRSPLATATACRANRACVIAALDGKTHSAAEYELLIDALRAVNRSSEALEYMQTYTERYPDERKGILYRRLLAAQWTQPAADTAPTPAPVPDAPAVAPEAAPTP